MSGSKVFVKESRNGMAGDIALWLTNGQYVVVRRTAESTEVYVANMTREELVRLLTGMGFEVRE